VQSPISATHWLLRVIYQAKLFWGRKYIAAHICSSTVTTLCFFMIEIFSVTKKFALRTMSNDLLLRLILMHNCLALARDPRILLYDHPNADWFCRISSILTNMNAKRWQARIYKSKARSRKNDLYQSLPVLLLFSLDTYFDCRLRTILVILSIYLSQF
jgi:hypothetical protein